MNEDLLQVQLILWNDALDRGRVALASGDWAQAEACLGSALSTAFQHWGEAHPAWAETVFYLARLSYARGDAVRARELDRRALEAFEAGGQGRHPIALGAALCLQLLYPEGPEEAGLESLQAARSEAARRFGPLSWQAARVEGRLGIWRWQHGQDGSQSLAASLRILNALRRQDLDWSTVGDVGEHLGQLCQSLGRTAQATDCWLASLEYRARRFGSESAEVALALAHLGALYLQLQQFSAAHGCAQRALELQERRLGVGSRQLAPYLGALYHCRQRMGLADPDLKAQYEALLTPSDGWIGFGAEEA